MQAEKLAFVLLIEVIFGKRRLRDLYNVQLKMKI